MQIATLHGYAVTRFWLHQTLLTMMIDKKLCVLEMKLN